MKIKKQSIFKKTVSAFLLTVLITGCSTSDPYVGQGPHPEFQRGKSIPPLDITASCLAFLSKLVLWNGKFADHKISKESEAEMIQFVDDRNTQGYPSFRDATFRLNQYAPWGDYYNPFTNTAHIYSGDALIGMHEAGHAYDFANLGQEMAATDEVINYTIRTRNRPFEYRAYGTYVGSYLTVAFGSMIGAVERPHYCVF